MSPSSSSSTTPPVTADPVSPAYGVAHLAALQPDGEPALAGARGQRLGALWAHPRGPDQPPAVRGSGVGSGTAALGLQRWDRLLPASGTRLGWRKSAARRRRGVDCRCTHGGASPPMGAGSWGVGPARRAAAGLFEPAFGHRRLDGGRCPRAPGTGHRAAGPAARRWSSGTRTPRPPRHRRDRRPVTVRARSRPATRPTRPDVLFTLAGWPPSVSAELPTCWIGKCEL